MPNNKDIRSYFELEINNLKELFKIRNELTQRAIDKAEGTMNERLNGLNEFRAQQADTIARFATMEKLDSTVTMSNLRFEALIKELDELKAYKSNMQGRLSVIIIIWPLVVGIVLHFLKFF